MRQLYLDICASAPLNPQVLKVFCEVASKSFANPSSVHTYGINAKTIVGESRQDIADILCVDPKEIVFTSGATESNNLAILGVIKHLVQIDSTPVHAIVSEIEHPSVYNVYKQLESRGMEISYLPVNEDGIVEIDQLKRLIKDCTRLISVMHVNNETGAIQPVSEIGKWIKQEGLIDILFHVDGVQGFGKLDIDLSNIDLYTLSGHKIGGLKGTGLLMCKSHVRLAPLLYGGNQEYGIRPGTTDTAGVRALAETVRLFHLNKKGRFEQLTRIHKYLYAGLQEISDVILNTPKNSLAAPHIINFSCPGIPSAVMLNMLSKHNIQVSSQSACSSTHSKVSRVLMASHHNTEIASSSIRVSFDENMTVQEAEYFLTVVKSVVHAFPKKIKV